MGIQVRMADGSYRTFNDQNELDAAIQPGSGNVPIDPNTGQAATVTLPYGAGGGTLINGAPLNVALGQGFTNATTAGGGGSYSSYAAGTSQQSELDRLYGNGYAQNVFDDWNPAPPGANQPPPATTGGNGNYNITDYNTIAGLGNPAPTIPNITLPQNPQLSQNFAPEITDIWQQLIAQGEGQIGDAYNNLATPTMNAAALQHQDVPQTTAVTPQSNSALQFLLSGQGYDPATLARMNAGAVDNAAIAGRSNRGASRLMSEQAGLAGSPAALAMESQANRQQGDATQQALNQIAIQNAQQGMQNLTTGAGMELGRSTSGAAMTNQNALDNAARLFSAMQQNVQNVQQANQQNAGFQQEQNMAKAGAQSNVASSANQTYMQALLGKAAGAEGQNVANSINRNLNQAQLSRQADIFNTTTGENRYSQALSGLLGLINGTNPFSYNISGANLTQNPNLTGANALQNAGNTAIQTGTGR